MACLRLLIASALAVALAPSFAAASNARAAADLTGPVPDATAPLPVSEVIGLRAVDDRLTVPVTIGAGGPYRFMVDTGAQATVLSRDLADSLGLADRQPAQLIGVGSIVATETVVLDELGFGTRRANLSGVPLVDRQNLSGADGVLGLDALQGHRVLFDFAARHMEVVAADSPRERGFEIVVRARARKGRLIIADAWIEGIRTALIIDTGAQASIGNPALARRLRRGSHGSAQLFDINGVQSEAQIHTAGEVRIQKLRFENVPIMFTPSPVFAALGLDRRPAMLLGLRELRLFRRVAIDFGSRTVHFDVPSTLRELDESAQRWQGG